MTNICPLCRRRLSRPKAGEKRPDVVYSPWTKQHYCGGARYRRCSEIHAATLRAERRHRAAA